ncbi:MAG: hypothetical protein IPI24_03260 [Ignavibacteria bacterium]|nr:hypothetical protein [Ignavibacteria bacterium]
MTYRSFRRIEVRGTDIYAQFEPEKITQMYHYISSDLGLTWRRYTPPSQSPHQAIPYGPQSHHIVLQPNGLLLMRMGHASSKLIVRLRKWSSTAQRVIRSISPMDHG